MKRFMSFCKSYFIEILFALLTGVILASAGRELVLYFIFFIVLTAVFTGLQYFLVVKAGDDEKKCDINEAIRLFSAKYGCKPQDKGFNAISFQETYDFYIYAVSDEVIVAYKQQQKIMNWIVKWYLWLWVAIVVSFVIELIICHNLFHINCLFLYIFAGAWIILYRVLNRKMRKTMPFIEINKTILLVNKNERV